MPRTATPCYPCAKDMHCYGSGISGSQGCVCRVCGPAAPDRSGDRDQQQAADNLRRAGIAVGHNSPQLVAVAFAIAVVRRDGEAAARAEEAARWQAKIEALEQQMQRRSYRCTWQQAAAEVRAVLGGEQR